VVPSVLVTVTDVFPLGVRPKTTGAPAEFSVVRASPRSSTPDVVPHTPAVAPPDPFSASRRQTSVGLETTEAAPPSQALKMSPNLSQTGSGVGRLVATGEYPHRPTHYPQCDSHTPRRKRSVVCSHHSMRADIRTGPRLRWWRLRSRNTYMPVPCSRFPTGNHRHMSRATVRPHWHN
jgi:hypothetical protein